MARNQKTASNSDGVCKKIRNAFSISTPFKAKIHRISSSTSSRHHPTPRPPQTDRPVPDDHAVRRDIFIANGESNGHERAARPASKTNDDNDGRMMKKVEGSKSNEKFSDYIRKVKDKMRTASNVGAAASSAAAAARTSTRRDSFNDKVVNYINRAKIKIRTTTSVGDDNGGSFK
ncbi:hypothetical protein Salat_2236300 [Sesamum alatum]|uniref:Uncharacterized protein n=1 Tax=Sesamum alatum TaxID=300844 RepID=A0AAE2CDL0_9LAMI|nr:hypothetical protein Salat_2236300 [Sesamum alatum]